MSITAQEYLEANEPEMLKEFKKIQEEDLQLFCQKQMDYGPGSIAMGTMLKTPEEVKLSLTGVIVRLNDKIMRLMNLVLKRKGAPNNESIEDSFTDLTVYGIIARCVARGKWGK